MGSPSSLDNARSVLEVVIKKQTAKYGNVNNTLILPIKRRQQTKETDIFINVIICTLSEKKITCTFVTVAVP